MTETTSTFQLLKSLNKHQEEPLEVEFDETTQTYIVADNVPDPYTEFEVHGDHVVEPIDPATQVGPGDPEAENEALIQHLHSFDDTIPTTNYVMDDHGELVEVPSYTTDYVCEETEAENEVFNVETLEELVNPTAQAVAEVKQETETPNKKDYKTMRLVEFQKSIEAQLQPILNEASKVHKLVSDAKTKTKKDFYNKKFVKLTDQVKKYVNTIQQIEAMISPEGTEHANATVPE